MSAQTATQQPVFEVKDCTLIAIATGRRALTLRELVEHVREVPADSIYYHFWGGLLQSSFEEREYNNDFAAWVRHGLHYHPLAERLAVLDPTDYPDLEDLRARVIDVMEESLYESEDLGWMHALMHFDLLRHQIVVFDTRRRVGSLQEMSDTIGALSPSSIFYHFIDARRREPVGVDDFRHWLETIEGDHQALVDRLAGIDPYFGQLSEVRDGIAAAFREHLGETG